VSENTMEVIFPTCGNCSAIIGDVWENDRIINAWQKNGHNHYQYKCPLCHTSQAISVPITGLTKDIRPLVDMAMRALGME